MNVVELPGNTFADIHKQLRTLAADIESGTHGVAVNVAWVLDCEHKEVMVGLAGRAASPDAVAVLLFEAAKIQLIRRMGK